MRQPITYQIERWADVIGETWSISGLTGSFKLDYGGGSQTN
jgi:hypothetical protein